MRGAAFLSGIPNAIVVDVGGTTTDVGVLRNSFPREASTQCKVRLMDILLVTVTTHCGVYSSTVVLISKHSA